MADKELIRQEIERRIKNLEFSLENNCVEKYSKLDILGNITTLESLLQFIDSLPEEPFDYTNVNIITKDFGELPQTIEQAAVQAHIELEECNGLSFVNTFSKGAEWQKQKDQETIKLAEDHAMLAGMNKMREEMIKDAVETTIVNDWQYGKDPDHAIIPAIHQRIEMLDVGDKVKIIIVKEEQQ